MLSGVRGCVGGVRCTYMPSCWAWRFESFSKLFISHVSVGYAKNKAILQSSGKSLCFLDAVSFWWFLFVLFFDCIPVWWAHLTYTLVVRGVMLPFHDTMIHTCVFSHFTGWCDACWPCASSIWSCHGQSYSSEWIPSFLLALQELAVRKRRRWQFDSE